MAERQRPSPNRDALAERARLLGVMVGLLTLLSTWALSDGFTTSLATTAGVPVVGFLLAMVLFGVGAVTEALHYRDRE